MRLRRGKTRFLKSATPTSINSPCSPDSKTLNCGDREDILSVSGYYHTPDIITRYETRNMPLYAEIPRTGWNFKGNNV